VTQIRKGDTVEVIAGKSKGVTGTVLRVFPAQQTVLVEGANRVTKHTKVGQTQRGAKTGGIVHQEAPIHISNVMLVDSESKKRTRIGSRFDEDGVKIRVSRRSGKDIKD
jgi:large subunit ribosomal protein L24